MPLYRTFNTQEEIDAEYDLGAQSDSFPAILDDWIADSEDTRNTLHCVPDVSFGPTLDETMDIFPAASNGAPIVLFIHGGYWRALSSKEFSFVATGLHSAGFTVAVSNYSLCPKVPISEITRQSRAAVSFLARHGTDYNGDPGNISVIGHSAGGQQAAMLVATDWAGEYGLGRDLIRTAVPMSGVYDLEPLRHSYLQPALQLDLDQITRQSPLRLIAPCSTRLLVTLGAAEPAEFHRQAEEYHAAWLATGNHAEYSVQAGHDHFTLLNEFKTPDSPLLSRFIDLQRGTSQRS